MCIGGVYLNELNGFLVMVECIVSWLCGARRGSDVTGLVMSGVLHAYGSCRVMEMKREPLCWQGNAWAGGMGP